MNIGVNFFGPKFKLYDDFEGTLDALKAGGISSAEVCIAFRGDGAPPKELNLQIPEEVIRRMTGGIWNLENAARRIAAVRAHGVTVISAHLMLGTLSHPDQLTELLPDLLEFGKANHLRFFVISPMKGLDGVRPLIPALRQVSDALAQAGITLLVHNHEMECEVENGTTALDYLLEQCPSLGLELDVGWAKFAGADPVALMAKYGDRIPLLHFKDIRADASPATRDTCFTAVGEGSIPLSAIMAQAKTCALAEHSLIIDQDDSPTDILADIIRGAAAIRAAAQ